MMEYDRVQLKRAARQAMKRQRPHPMLVTLLFGIVVSIGSQIIDRILGAASGSSGLANLYYQAVLEYGDPAAAFQYVMLSFPPHQLVLALLVGGLIAGVVTSLWSGLMRTGYAGFCLDMVRGRQPQIEALFSAFPRWAGVLLTQFLAGLFRTLWALLLGVGLIGVLFVFALLAPPYEVFMLILLASYIAFLLGYTWLTLQYALGDYLIADQGLTGMDAIRESKRLMQGNTGRLFTLKLSFIGWYLLEAAVIAVALIAAVVLAAAGASGLDSFSGAETIAAMVGGLVFFIPLALIAAVGIGIFNLWLTPYITGAEALFYDWAGGMNSAPGGGWGRPQVPDQPQRFDYTWTSGPRSGTGIGPGPKDGGNGTPPRPPRPPKDDPWD